MASSTPRDPVGSSAPYPGSGKHPPSEGYSGAPHVRQHPVHPGSFAQPHLTHLPPPYAPVGGQSLDPAYLSHAPHQYPSVMVYPPPPPPDNRPSSISPAGRRESVQLPSMGSWAPPPPPRSNHSSPSLMAQANQAPSQVHEYGQRKRRPSDAEEVEAGMALAGMVMAGNQAKKEQPGPKKVKKEDTKKADSGNKKSCSECRRLKAKCDRVFPCSNCRRRGCALVCPDGDLSCMQGKRLVLASTEQLHERVAQLEAALGQAHAKLSSAQHPLLAPQYLDGGFAAHPAPPLEETLQLLKNSASPPLVAKVEQLDSISPKGPLSSAATSNQPVTPLNASERSSSQNRMAVESLLMNENAAASEGKREDEWVGENAAPAMIVGNHGQLPTGNEHHLVVERLRSIIRILPPREETQRRAANFWVASSWYNSMLKKEEFDAIYEPAVYAPTPANPLSPHKLACVLMLLTLDTYFDLALEEDNKLVAEYWDGAQRCFDTRFGWAGSVAGVQALALATLFVGFGWRGARASNFYWLRMMTSAAQQIGLHKDPHATLPEDERDFRRRVFWDCYTIDCLMSINHGQRTAVAIENAETLMPDKAALPVHKLKYQYMQTVKSTVIEIGCRPDSAPAPWSTVEGTDKLLKQYDVKLAPNLHTPVLSDKVMPPIASDPNHLDAQDLNRCGMSMCHYKAMLFLYRPSLRRLITRLRSLTGNVTFSDEDRQTVSNTYNACHAITATSVYMSRTHPRLSARCWAVWVQTFSAAVSMAALAIWCGPHLEPHFVKSAHNELTDACNMIRENGSKRSQGVLSLLPILQSLVHSRYPQLIGQDPATAKISVESEDMLYALLGGQVDQKGVQPRQGSLMNNPPMLYSVAPAPTIDSQPTAGPKPAPIITVNTAPQAQAFAPTPASYNWQNQPDALLQMALPLVAPHPTASPLDGYPAMPFQIMGEDDGFGDTSFESMSNEDLWARLQTFYEPTPAYWGQSVGGGYADYGMMPVQGVAMGLS